MSESGDRSQFPWGRTSFAESVFWDGSSQMTPNHQEHLEQALADPHYDFFSHHMPSHRPKHDIGRYVASHGIPVPLIDSMEQWQRAFLSGKAMLRSELPQDYSGLSGLLYSHKFILHETYPKDEHGNEEFRASWRDSPRTYEGPPQATVSLGQSELLQDRYADYLRTLGSTALVTSIRKQFTEGLYSGSLNPDAFMTLAHWQRDFDNIVQHATSSGLPMPAAWLEDARTSRWEYIPGVNIRIFRDPIVEGRYFIGGRDAHHHWETTGGRGSPNLEAYPKSVYRGAEKTPDSLEYTLPTRQIIDMYETVRQLPLFDSRQAPVMEMQYGDDGELYFLQYLKTGHHITPTPVFALPTGRDIVTVHDVRGATDPSGEQLRIYLDPRKFGKAMYRQAFYADYNLETSGRSLQMTSLDSRVMIINYFLSFKDNHFDSSPLTRAPIALGLWDDVGEAEERFRAVMSSQEAAQRRRIKETYINAAITSNGRQATIASDWQIHDEQLG